MRPTPRKVVMALFQILGPVEGYKVLELFAGTGRVSDEALGGGAVSVRLVEKSRTEVVKLKQMLKYNENAEVYSMDVRRAIPLLKKKGARYDLVFADPPYEKGWVEWLTIVEAHDVAELLEEGGLLVIEHSIREKPRQEGAKDLVLVQTRRYGDTCLSIFRKKNEGRKKRDTSGDIPGLLRSDY
ncbi:MAG: RsmD family RNA methyltransferase [Thermovirgaceae bacterium]